MGVEMMRGSLDTLYEDTEEAMGRGLRSDSHGGVEPLMELKELKERSVKVRKV